jgi:hypothetical protein
MKNLKHYTDWQLISEAKSITNYDLDEVESEDDEDNVKTLFINLIDHGYSVNIDRASEYWHSWQAFFTDFLKTKKNPLHWNVDIGIRYEDNNIGIIEENARLFKELLKIKKRCYHFELNGIQSTNEEIKIRLSVAIDEPVSLEKLFQKAIEQENKFEYTSILKDVFRFFCQDKSMHELTDIIGYDTMVFRVPAAKIVRIFETYKYLNKRRIFDLDNDKMIFTYDFTSDLKKTAIPQVLEVVRDYFVVIPGENKQNQSNPNRRSGWSKGLNSYQMKLFEPFKVIYHNKENNIFDFEFKKDENIAFEVQFSMYTNDELKKGVTARGEVIYSSVRDLNQIYPQLVKRLA